MISWLFGSKCAACGARVKDIVSSESGKYCKACHSNRLRFLEEAEQRKQEAEQKLEAERKRKLEEAEAEEAERRKEGSTWTPLLLAASGGELDQLRKLLVLGADVNECSGRLMFTPLHEAVIRGDELVVAELLACSADPTIVDAHGYAAIHWAAHRGFPNVIALLLSAGVEVDARIEGPMYYHTMNRYRLPPSLCSIGATALMVATVENHPEAVSVLLASGADTECEMDPKTCYSRGNRIATNARPLHVAAALGHTEVARRLLQHGVIVSAECSMDVLEEMKDELEKEVRFRADLNQLQQLSDQHFERRTGHHTMSSHFELKLDLTKALRRRRELLERPRPTTALAIAEALGHIEIAELLRATEQKQGDPAQMAAGSRSASAVEWFNSAYKHGKPHLPSDFNLFEIPSYSVDEWARRVCSEPWQLQCVETPVSDLALVTRTLFDEMEKQHRLDAATAVEVFDKYLGGACPKCFHGITGKGLQMAAASSKMAAVFGGGPALQSMHIGKCPTCDSDHFYVVWHGDRSPLFTIS